MSWELERLQSEWKEKELRCGNIREQYEEQGKSEKQLRLEEQCRALEIAEERMAEGGEGDRGEYGPQGKPEGVGDIFRCDRRKISFC